MIHNMIGGGAAALNFKIANNPQPENPKENTLWIDTDEEITSWDFSAEQPYLRSGNKNLFCYPFSGGTGPFTTQNKNGIRYEDDGDGTIYVSGTSTYESTHTIAGSAVDDGGMYLPSGSYFLSGASAGCYLELRTRYGELVRGSDNGVAFTLDTPTLVWCRIVIPAGTNLSNGLVIKPQLERGSVATDFVKGDATGQVWIQTNPASGVSFNVLKRNNLMVYPSNAKQYVPSQGWVDKTAKLYNGSKWIDL